MEKKEHAEPVAGYLNLPRVDLYPDGPVRVARKLTYYSERFNEWVVIPVGYVSDLLSVPWGFRWLFPKAGAGRNEAILHDYLCDDGKKPRGERHYPQLSSGDVHRMFEEALIASEIPRWRRRALSRAVLWFGPKFKSYEKKQKQMG